SRTCFSAIIDEEHPRSCRYKNLSGGLTHLLRHQRFLILHYKFFWESGPKLHPMTMHLVFVWVSTCLFLQHTAPTNASVSVSKPHGSACTTCSWCSASRLHLAGESLVHGTCGTQR